MQHLPGTVGAKLSAMRTMYPCELELVDGPHQFVRPTSTTYGYVARGGARIEVATGTFSLREGSYFAVPGSFSVIADGLVMLVQRTGYLGMLNVGAVEERGRLAYIDGCSDSVLVAPPRRGDPVLNHLHFPANTLQTQHTHPSVRLGMVIRGSGEAYGPGWTLPLHTGDVFLLVEHEIHAFRTNQSTMDILAFHPDSDEGPTDGAHPMISRTFINRRSQ